MPKASDLLAVAQLLMPLSATQRGIAKDAGFWDDVYLDALNQSWYENNLNILHAPAVPRLPGTAFSKQTQTLESYDVEIDVDLSYQQAQQLLRMLAKHLGTDTGYIAFIEEQEIRRTEHFKDRLKK